VGGQRPRRDNRAIAERIELERQCRTLFVRNISVSLSAQHSNGSAPGRQESLFLRLERARGGVGADSRKDGKTDHKKIADL